MTSQTTDTPDACLDRIRRAWDAGDAHASGQEFTVDATYVIFLGDLLDGREKIEQNHVDVFSKWQKGTKMIVEPISTRTLSSDVVTILTKGGIGTSSPLQYDKLQTFTMILREQRWLRAAFQNASMNEDARGRFNER